jgi:hypothetical protein
MSHAAKGGLERGHLISKAKAKYRSNIQTQRVCLWMTYWGNHIPLLSVFIGKASLIISAN